ncbi:hypothetical protein CONLIGDRAFT_105519 [Coniochaeta ligniaria NRRL 30616]|uniref:DH domain-containing protein n=1 Tax=Coniochaeta ligniaria NRRL 30616 TaxID=1408157 RepID=A0A1J7JB05_9PEZI|nr:hypothetical protein CONLIGDRAFT_105519 [Coniochaeta ligniaria NRRL 30616]
MDPLTISGTVLGIAVKCVTVARDLSTLRDKYMHASLTISAICSESAVVNAALCKLQSLFSQPQDEGFVQFQSRPELASACDTALTGCTLLYSCLDDEVQSLRIQAQANATVELTWSQKSKVVWKDSTMKELLQQIRGQTSALSLLLQCFHFEHALETRHLLVNQGEAIIQIKTNMSVLRSAYQSKHNMPESVLGDKRSIQTVFADNASVMGDLEFSFDDIVVNSRAYRRVMAAAMSYTKDQASHRPDVPNNSSTSSVQDQAYARVSNGETNNRSVSDAAVYAAGPAAATQAPKTQAGMSQESQLHGPSVQTRRHQLDERFFRALALPLPATDMNTAEDVEPVEWQHMLEFDGLAKADMLEVPKPLIEFQNAWFGILSSERDHIRHLQATKTIFADQILLRRPKVVQEPEQFVSEVFRSLDEMISAHVEHMYQPLVQHWATLGAWAYFNPGPFHDLLDHASGLMLHFCSNIVKAIRRVEIESEVNPQFRQFLETQEANSIAEGLGWKALLNAPITRFQRYSLLLTNLSLLLTNFASDVRYTGHQITRALDELKKLLSDCDTLVGDAKKDVDWIDLSIRFKPREYSTKIATFMSWVPRGEEVRCQIQAFCQIKQHSQIPHWAWCEVIVTEQYIIVANMWKWTTPSERQTERDPSTCALSLEMDLDNDGKHVKCHKVKSRRKQFGRSSVPREAGESALVMECRRAYISFTDHTALILTGKSSDLTRVLECVYV